MVEDKRKVRFKEGGQANMISWPWKKPKIYRHGDLLIRQVKKIPESATQLSTNIIAHGENGHSHKLHGSHQVYEIPDKQILFEAKQDLSLKHQEHNTLKISKGNYVVVHEREYNPFKNIQEEVID